MNPLCCIGQTRLKLHDVSVAAGTSCLFNCCRLQECVYTSIYLGEEDPILITENYLPAITLNTLLPALRRSGAAALPAQRRSRWTKRYPDQ